MCDYFQINTFSNFQIKKGLLRIKVDRTQQE